MQLNLTGQQFLDRPLLMYFGSKWQMAPDIVKHFPQCKKYVEPFSGSYACGFRYFSEAQRVLNDIHPELINFYEVLKTNPDKFINFVKYFKFDQDSWDMATKLWASSSDPIHRAAGFYFRSWMSYCGEGRRWVNTRTNKRDGKSPDIETLEAAHKALQDITLQQCDALDAIRQWDSPKTLFYVDPTYHWTARGTKDKRHKDMEAAMPRCQYLHEYTNVDHVKLAMVLNTCKGAVILSGKQCEAYDLLYEGWARTPIHGQDQTGKKTVEYIWHKPAGHALIEKEIAVNMASLLFMDAEVAPKGAFIDRDKTRNRVDWRSKEPVFDGKKRKYIGLIDSDAHKDAIRALNNRKLLTKLNKHIRRG